MTSRQVGRVNGQSKGETHEVSGVLQRAAVRAVAEKVGEATHKLESGELSQPRFVHDFSQVPIEKVAFTEGINVSKVQQKQGWVKPMFQAKGVEINNDQVLGREADAMGAKAIQRKCSECEGEDKEKAYKKKMNLEAKTPIQFAKGDSCYCPGWSTLSPYHAKREDIVPVGPGELFTTSQTKYIQGLNRDKSKAGEITTSITSYYDSDTDGSALVTKDEVTHLLAEVDHIVPKESWGCNSLKNAQVISADENGKLKGTTYPYGRYKGWSVFDPKKNMWHPDKADAITKGATNAHLLP